MVASPQRPRRGGWPHGLATVNHMLSLMYLDTWPWWPCYLTRLHGGETNDAMKKSGHPPFLKSAGQVGHDGQPGARTKDQDHDEQ